MDKDKLKIEITWSGDNISFMMTYDEKPVKWSDLSREEQITILYGFAQGCNFFLRFLKEK